MSLLSRASCGCICFTEPLDDGRYLVVEDCCSEKDGPTFHRRDLSGKTIGPLEVFEEDVIVTKLARYIGLGYRALEISEALGAISLDAAAESRKSLEDIDV